jgi:hypothetical protein
LQKRLGYEQAKSVEWWLQQQQTGKNNIRETKPVETAGCGTAL